MKPDDEDDFPFSFGSSPNPRPPKEDWIGIVISIVIFAAVLGASVAFIFVGR